MYPSRRSLVVLSNLASTPAFLVINRDAEDPFSPISPAQRTLFPSSAFRPVEWTRDGDTGEPHVFFPDPWSPLSEEPGTPEDLDAPEWSDLPYPSPARSRLFLLRLCPSVPSPFSARRPVEVYSLPTRAEAAGRLNSSLPLFSDVRVPPPTRSPLPRKVPRPPAFPTGASL
ncbi:hypothetical protein JCM10213_001272 [Rhodosporidiobolus nylandii]